ncbi:MAG TPA: galactose-1-epimerase [Gemmatimonadales bacterium]|nr:galactose-1-epimerase [Gemmatimonadales bacterium]
MPRPHRASRLLLAMAFLLAGSGHAQESKRPRAPGAPPPVGATGDSARTTIPFFPLGESPLALAGDVRAGTFVSAVGRRAIAMGTEDGRFELWSWPIKWLHDFELFFRIPKYVEPIPGHTLARSMVYRPEGLTIEYAYEQFTVRQHVFVPLDLPAVIMLLEVDAVRPLDVIARWTPDIHYAWPAGLGGQYLIWEQNAQAFLFSEGRRKVNAFLGSPAVTRASDVPAHMLAAERPQLVLGVGGEGERYTTPSLGEPPGRGINLRVAYVPIVLAGGDMPRDSALALYRRLIAPGAAEREWRRRVSHADSIRRNQLALRSPDSLLDRAVELAKLNLDEGLVCNPDLGCGLVAGYGLSGGASDRPGFGWFFGGDAAINSFAMTGVGQHGLVRQGVLEFFAKYQRADGKITHEISQAAGRIPWFTEYPYAFYHGDTTPFWILAFGEYWKQTADTGLVRTLWPALRKAYDWSRRTDTDGDGLMENPVAGAGALEVGDLQIGILSDVYLSGVWVAALDRFARMAEVMGRPALGDSARRVRERARSTMESRLWMPARSQYAFALLQDGTVNENLTAWPATAMAFDVFDRARGAEMAARLASSEIMTDWGARPLAASSALFDPLHYNNGAVWPFVTGWVSLAQYRYHHAAAGKFALDAIARTGFDEARGRNPEVISGRLYKPLDTSVPQQLFATSMVLTPLLRGLLGLDVDAPAGRLTLAPHLPPEWDSLAVENIPVGPARVSARLTRSEGGLRAELRQEGSGAPLDVVFSPALPLGAATSLETTETPGDLHATARGSLRDHLVLEVPFQGGWSIAAPVRRPAIGDRSSAPRVLSERLVRGAYTVTLEGRAGRQERFRIREGGRWREVDVTFPSADPGPDGYTRTTMTFRSGGAQSGQASPRVSRAPFGRLPGGGAVDGYTIRNGRGTSIHVMTYGAIITSIRTRDRAGRFEDITLGYDDLEGYLKETPYFGAVVGRYANRIAKGRFTLDGRTYQVPVNNGPNSLHGGTRGFDKVLWRAAPFENDTAAGLVLTHVSPDGDMGYPGRLEVRVTYTLTDADELAVDYLATTTRPTPVNLSQHTYFNLAGDGRRDILGHILQLNAGSYTPVDSTLIPTGEIASVAGTPFDFRSPAAIGARIGEGHEQLRRGGGYDHNFVLDRRGGGQVHAARVVEPESGRTLDIFTDQPGIQFYSGNFLDGTIRGKGSRVYAHRFGFCLETQHFPDSPNQPRFPSTILRPGERYASRTIFRFGTAE